MSVKKVDEYKKYKSNRKKILKHEKFMKRLEYTLIAVACAVFVGWVGWSVYQNVTAVSSAANSAVTATAVNFNGYANYFGDLTLSYE